VLGFSAGWGYNGVFVHGVVRLHPEAPAAATGVTHVGSFVGPTLGPPLFGVVASSWSYDAAWTMIAISSLLAAVFVQLARRQVARERDALTA
jgi:predicted MFS family arabinose efflux permease